MNKHALLNNVTSTGGSEIGIVSDFILVVQLGLTAHHVLPATMLQMKSPIFHTNMTNLEHLCNPYGTCALGGRMLWIMQALNLE